MLQIRQFENLLPVYDKSLLTELGEKASALHHLQQFVQYLSDSDEESQSLITGILTKLFELQYLSKQTKGKKRKFRRLSTDFVNPELISKSGSTSVYLAQSKHDSSFYCLKAINPQHPKFLDRITHILPYMTRFDHENIVRYHSCWIELKMKKEQIVPMLYIQLELCNSTPFQEAIQQLNDDQLLHVALSISECLSYIHSNQVAYGNLRPSDILFSLDGIPKIDLTAASFSPLSQEARETDLSALKKIIDLLFEGSALSNLSIEIQAKDNLTDIISTLKSLVK